MNHNKAFDAAAGMSVLSELKQYLDSFRMGLLTSEIEVGLDPQAAQFYLLAIGAIEQAVRFAELGDLAQTRAVVAIRMAP